MPELLTNGSIDFKRVTQSQLGKVEQLHDEHSEDIRHSNDTIYREDTALNYHATPLNLNELLEEQYGAMIATKNAKLDKQFKDGKISKARYEERHTDFDKYLNHSGDPKKAFTLGIAYGGDENETKAKLDALGFDYTVVKIKSERDGHYHNHFHLTNPKQRQEWRDLWIKTFSKYVNTINKVDCGIKVFDYTIHMDEASPHVHMKILNMGHSKSGRPSYNLNQSLSDWMMHSKLVASPSLSRATKKTPNQHLSGKETFREANKIFSQLMVVALQNTFNSKGIKFKYQPKGDKAKLTNNMTADEYKAYQATVQELHDAYTNVTGLKPKPDDTLLDISNGIKNGAERLSEERKAIDEQKDQLRQKQSEMAQKARDAQFNSFVQHQLILRLDEQRKDKLRKLHQRETELQRQEDTMAERVTKRVLDVISAKVDHILDDAKKAVNFQLQSFKDGFATAQRAKEHAEHNIKFNQRRLRNLRNNNVIGTITQNEVKKEQSNKPKHDDNEFTL